jgi:hypothetical protein
MDDMACRSFSPPEFSLDSSNSCGAELESSEASSCEMPEMGSPAMSTEGPNACEMPTEVANESSESESMSIDPSLDNAGQSHAPICVEANYSAGPEWESFATAFNQEFRAIMHVFETDPARCSPEAPEGLSGAQLANLFTEQQRVLLTSFFDTHRIPDRLFNGDEIGHTNAQQRLLMSAHILAEGTYTPGSFEQRVHARMCFHWVRIVHAYAGASTGSGNLVGGVMGNFDHAGNAVTGTARTETVFGRSRAAEGEAQTPPGNRMLPYDQFDSLQPGDWMYIYNANSPEGIGAHSVIFSHWETGDQVSEGGVRHRVAALFSQGGPEGGGRPHTNKLGERYSGGEHIYPIILVTRVNSDAHPATNVSELLPEGSEARERRLSADNQAHLDRARRMYGRTVNLSALMTAMRTENTESIATVRDHLTPGQIALFTEANRTQDIETMVRLTERLRQLRTNTGVLERNTAATFDEDLNTRHAEINGRVEMETMRLDSEIEAIDQELAPNHARIEALLARQENITVYPEIAAKRQEVRAVNARLEGMPRTDPERPALRERRAALIAEIQALVAAMVGHRPEMAAIRRELSDLRSSARPLTNRRARLVRERSAIAADLPYGLVHSGALRGHDDRSSMTGRLSTLFPLPALRPFLTPVGGE